jgi:hypothetical protein
LGNGAQAGGERATAFVVEAEPPLDNLIKLGRPSHGRVRILVGGGKDRIYVRGGRHKRDRDHWLVPGMQVPVTIDRARPDAFEVLWDEIPSMAERAAASEPTLADPIGTGRKVNEAVIAATSAIDTSAMPSELAEAVAKAQSDSARTPDTVPEQLAQAQQEPAPAGKQRAVVLVATSTRKLATEAAGERENVYETSRGTHDTVLSVHLPGQEPYAVYKEKLKHPRTSGLPRGVGIPALVSQSDPTDIELDWKGAEAAGQAQLGQRMQAASEKMQQAQQMMSGQQVGGQLGEPQQALAKATEDANKQGPPAGMPTASQIDPQMRQMMIQNAKMAFANTPPQMRELLIQQYRSAGIDFDDQGNVAE